MGEHAARAVRLIQQARVPSRQYTDVRDAAVGQYARLGQVVGDLSDHELVLPTLLGDWTVADLVAHVTAGVEALTRYVTAADAPARAELDLVGYLTGTASVAAGVAQRAREAADAATGEELRARLRRCAVQAALALQRVDDGADRVVAARLGAVPLTDFLATRCVEGVVHSLDLAAAVELAPDAVLVPAALRVAVRALAETLAAVHPGRSVELRVPGPSGTAVQCVAGPPHKRGTPGNVVEADAVTFVLLATGRLSWQHAVDTGAVHASGSRSDLSALLPVMS